MWDRMQQVFGEFAPLVAGLGISALLLSIVFPLAQCFPERYSDFIAGVPAITFTNKTMEWYGFWFAFWAGCAGMVYLLWRQRSAAHDRILHISHFTELGLIWLVIPTVFRSLFYGVRNWQFWYAWLVVAVFAVLYFLFRRGKITDLHARKMVLLLLVSYYACLGVAAVVGYWREYARWTTLAVSAPVVFVCGCFCYYQLCQGRGRFVDRAIAFLQCLIPLGLTFFAMDRYAFGKEVVHIPWPMAYLVFFGVIGAVLLRGALLHVRRIWRASEEMQSVSPLISWSTVAMLCLWHAFWGSAKIWGGDLWHAGDLMLAWQQCVVQGHAPCFEFMPNSGFFGILPSVFQHYFLTPDVMNFNASNTLFYVACGLWIAVLAWNHFSPATALLLSTMLAMVGYQRPLLILPTLWTLLLPQLMAMRVYWLCAYVVLGIVGFFFYPLHGAATGVGLFPLAVYQVYRLCRERKQGSALHPLQILVAVVTLGIFAMSMPYVAEMFRYMLAMSGQTLLADGIPTFPFGVPEWFLPWLGRSKAVVLLFNVMEYLLPFLCLMLPAWYVVRAFRVGQLRDSSVQHNLVWMGAVFFTLLVSMQYAMVRIEGGRLLPRCWPTLRYLIVGLLVMVMLRLYQERRTYGRLVAMGLLTGIASLLYSSMGTELPSVGRAFRVPNGYERVSVQEFPALGDGFMNSDHVKRLRWYRRGLTEFSSDREPVVLPEQVAYLVFERPTALSGATPNIRYSYSATADLLRDMEYRKPPVLHGLARFYFPLNGLYTMYLVDWMLAHQYVAVPRDGEFFWLSPTRLQERFPKDWQKKREEMEDHPVGMYLPQNNKSYASFGTSIKSLERRMELQRSFAAADLQMETIPNGYRITFPAGLRGEQILYLDLRPRLDAAKVGRRDRFAYEASLRIHTKKTWPGNVSLRWVTTENRKAEARTMKFPYMAGEFLLPLGNVPSWRGHTVQALEITFDHMQAGVTPEVRRLHTYKLKYEE